MEIDSDGPPSPPKPCAACDIERRACGPDCIFRPYFPNCSQADYARVRALFDVEDLTNVITILYPELAYDTIRSLIYQARRHAENQPVDPHLRRLDEIQSLLIGLLRRYTKLQGTDARTAQTANPQDPQGLIGDVRAGETSRLRFGVMGRDHEASSSGANSLPVFGSGRQNVTGGGKIKKKIKEPHRDSGNY